MAAPLFPNADEAARVIVTACSATGDAPLSVADGSAPLQARARAYAFIALAVAFPGSSQVAIGRIVGGGDLPGFVAGSLGMARKRPSWWSHGTICACLRAIGRPDCTEETAEVRRLGVTMNRSIIEPRASEKGR